MGDIKRSGSGIYLQNVPDQLTKEQKIALLDDIEANMGQFSGDYSSAIANLHTAKNPNVDRLAGQTSQGSVTREADLLLEQQEAAKTTAKGMVDAYTREVAPSLGAGAAGLVATGGNPLGAAGGILAELLTRAFSPAVANQMNEKLNTGELSWEEATNQLFDKLGMERADTPAERMAQTAGQGTREAAGMIAGGTALQTGAPALGTGSVPQQVGQVLKEAPVAQLTGGALSGAGAQAGAEIAESQEMGPIASTLMTLGGGILGDISGTQLASLEDQVRRLMIAKDIPLPQAAQETLDLFTGKSKMLLSDIGPKTRRAADYQDYREVVPGGTRELRYSRQQQRQQAVSEMVMDLEPNDYYSRDIVDDFMSRRQGELTELTGLRDEVIEKFSGEGAQAIEVPETVALIDDIRADLMAGGDQSMMPLIDKLTNWENMIQGKNLDQMIAHKRSISNLYADPAFTHMKTDTQKTVNAIRDSLSKEIDDYVREAGTNADFIQWKVTNNRLSEMASDFDAFGLQNTLNNGADNAATINQMLFSNDKETVEKLYDRLTPEGRTRAQAAIMAKAAEEATDLGKLSPTQFARKMRDLGTQTGVFFDADDAKQLEGTVRWLEMTADDELIRSAQAAMPGEGLPGGRYALARVIFGNPLVGIPLAAGSKISAGKLVQVLEQDDVRDLLIKLAEVPPTPVSANFRQSIAKRLGEVLRGYSATDPDFEQPVEEERQR